MATDFLTQLQRVWAVVMPDEEELVGAHFPHFLAWRQDGANVVCPPCQVILYEGDAPTKPTDYRTIDLQTTVLGPIERPDKMPDRTFRVASPPEEPTQEEEYDQEAEEAPREEVRAPSPQDNGHAIEVNGMGSYVEITSVYSRTTEDSSGRWGSTTAGITLKETFPGEMSAGEIAEVAEGHYTILKPKVLDQLGLPYEQDPNTLLIMEVFPGSTTVARGPAQPQQMAPSPSAPVPAPAPAGRFRSGGASAAPAPRTAQRGRTGGSGGWEPAPSQAEMWTELLDYPHLWFWNANKDKDTSPDFISTHYKNEQGYPASLWLEGRNGPNCPDEEALNAIPDEAFAQTKPRTPQARR